MAQPKKSAPAAPKKQELTVVTEPASLIQATPMPEGATLFLREAKGEREVPSSVPLIKIDHRESKFILPSGEVVDSVSGYPVYYFHTRKYYKSPPRPGVPGGPPDCWSGDCLVPSPDALDRQATTCAECPNNQFGTGRDGRSKACATLTWVFLLNPKYGSPPIAVVVAPSSSLRALVGTRFQQGYFAQAQARHGVYEIVWSTFSLEQQGGQVVYCTLKPEMGRAAEDLEEVKAIARVRNQFLDAMNLLRGSAGTVQVEAEHGEEVE